MLEGFKIEQEKLLLLFINGGADKVCNFSGLVLFFGSTKTIGLEKIPSKKESDAQIKKKRLTEMNIKFL